MESVKISGLCFCVEDRPAVFLRAITDTEIKLYLCFSIVEVSSKFLSLKESDIVITQDIIDSFEKGCEEANIPVFDVEEGWDFDPYLSVQLSHIFDELEEAQVNLLDLEEYSKIFHQSNFFNYWIPQRGMAEIKQYFPHIKETTGLVVRTNPFEGRIYHSKRQAAHLINYSTQKKKRGLKKLIAHSSLPDDTWEPCEELSAPVAHVLGYLYCLRHALICSSL